MKKRDDEFHEPDLTPLIDVVFILLIFFLVTSVFKKQELALLLDLPKSESFEKNDADKDKIAIEMKDNQILISGQSVSVSGLAKTLKGKKNDSYVNIRSDRLTQYYKVIEVLDVLKKNNFTKINLVTELGKE